MTGGAAAQHAMIAQEFRRMASEIGSFLESKASGKKKAMPAPKKPAAKKAGAAAPKKKKAAAAAPKKKKVAAARAGFW